ncbi:MAG TPA: peptidoglycan DD-metalloendopeptidase family protein [Alphaproteobacteria bacterium]|nr:peptidoglycan DD-metalloendopeptidase family protein [Alphaproteobacteria bacterium]
MYLKKEEILAQKPDRQLPYLPNRWPLLLAAIPFFGVVAAFGIAPDTVPEPIDIRQVVEEVALPVLAVGAGVSTERFWREDRIRPGDTVATLFSRLGVEDAEALAYLLQARGIRSLYQLVPGRAVRAITTGEGKLDRFSYLNPNGQRLLLERNASGLRLVEEMPALEARVLQSSGEITTSLFGATDAAGLHESIATQLVDIFSSDIDFHRDLRKGDRFSVVYEATYLDGEFAGVGRVLAAEFINAGQAYRAVYFRDDAGHAGYYTPEGRNVRKAFLRSPIEFSRITSGFSRSRFHPILKTWRAHRGIDYGAPTGTRVRATANAVVISAGWQNGYGKAIRLRHPNGYTTLYGHLSDFADGIRPGHRVAQGDVIGFVGQTGLASGPHLHYEFLVNGAQVNPMRLALPPGPPITELSRPAFEEASQPLFARLEQLRDTNLAQLD